MPVTAWFSDDILQAICRTFLHSLWQGIPAALLAGLVLLLTKRSRASLRYNLLGAVLLLFLGGAGLTFYLEMQSASPAPALQTAVIAVSGVPSAPAPQPDLLTRFLQFTDAHSAQIMMAWALVFLLKCIRLGAGFYHIFRIRHSNTIQPPVEWAGKLRQLALSLGIHAPVKLMESARVQMPFTVGWLKPCIYVPAGLLAQLPADQLEAILLHELAHIRRRDYLVNILQRFAEIIFFFNPALLWISACIREEREACCDDIAVAHTPRQASYLQALVAFENAGQQVQLGMALGQRKFYLLDRVKRILTNENKKLTIMEKGILLLGLAGITAFGFVPAGEQPVPKAQLEIVEMVKDTTIKPFRTVKVKRDTTHPKKLHWRADSVKYKLKTKHKDSLHVFRAHADSVYYKVYSDKIKGDSTLIHKYYRLAMDSSRLKAMKGKLQAISVDSSYKTFIVLDSSFKNQARIYHLNALKHSDSAYVLVKGNKMRTAKLNKLHYDSAIIYYKWQLADSSLKERKFKRLPDSSIKKFKQKTAPREIESRPTAFQVLTRPQRMIVKGQATTAYTMRMQATAHAAYEARTELFIEPVTYSRYEQEKTVPSKPKATYKKSAEKEMKKTPEKQIKWHQPRYNKPTFREKAGQALPSELQKHLVPPVADC
ncbi:M56 family metallopeptidase [Chitinophaga sp. YIM B06452]|uniref:M56 family metallopeptidase n=1 Tax=Chitinophaga sp. YIM B06452 TaxID=3082158 RepID=UPI0031FEBA05